LYIAGPNLARHKTRSTNASHRGGILGHPGYCSPVPGVGGRRRRSQVMGSRATPTLAQTIAMAIWLCLSDR
jgi:hypothetical protein